VVGSYHPADRAISYLKYVPSEIGRWGNRKEKFSRVMRSYTIPSLIDTFNVLKQEYPQYLFYSTVLNITMTAVPHEYIKKHYRPEETLRQILQKKRPDSLQKKLVDFVSFLAKTCNVSLESFGVTGSLLLNIHKPEFSDIDVTVYSLKDSVKLKKALMEMHLSKDSALRRFEGSRLKAWCKSKAENFPLTENEALQIYKRKWNYGIFKGTLFSIHPTKTEQEIDMVYGDETYCGVGSIIVRVKISDAEESIFLPAKYQVKDVDILDGPKVEGIKEVVSYEGLYSDVADTGQTIIAKGKLERVKTKVNKEHYRVLVGSIEGKGKEYIKSTTTNF
jgi:predicted nucleotidyltransferase